MKTKKLTLNSLVSANLIARLTNHSYNAVRAWVADGRLHPATGCKGLKFRLIEALNLPRKTKVTMANIRALIRQSS